MTERGGKWVYRDEERFQIGPSQLHWDGQALVIDIDEVNVPIPMRKGEMVDMRPSGIAVLGRKSTPGRYFQVANPGNGWGGTDIA
ncbi:MAG: hypothetical protein RIR83_1149, partial [Pseudomonadota bacterium]